MCWDVGILFQAGIHCPPYHSRSALSSQIIGDSPITGHASFRNEPYHGPYLLEEILVPLRVWNRSTQSIVDETLDPADILGETQDLLGIPEFIVIPDIDGRIHSILAHNSGRGIEYGAASVSNNVIGD